MIEVLREADRIKGLLEDALDELEALREACEQVGADDAAGSTEEAADNVREAVASLGDIWYETES
jgi:hypothetical protein